MKKIGAREERRERERKRQREGCKEGKQKNENLQSRRFDRTVSFVKRERRLTFTRAFCRKHVLDWMKRVEKARKRRRKREEGICSFGRI